MNELSKLCRTLSRRWSRRLGRRLGSPLLSGALLLGASVGCGPGAAVTPQGTPQPLAAKAGDIDPGPLLEDSVKAATEAGATEARTLGAQLLAEGELLGGFVDAPEDSCILALARPGASVNDVDLFMYSDAGERLAADEAPSARAAVLVCPPHPRRMYVAARLVGGEGMLALAVMRVPPKAADAVAAKVEVRGRPGQDTGKLEAWPGLERKIRMRRQQLGSGWEDVRRATLPLHPDAPSVLSTVLPARRCVDVMVVPEEAIQAVDVQVLDESGRIVALGKPPGRDRTLLMCSEIEQRLSILVRPRVTSGLAAVVVARSPLGAASELPAGLWVDGASALHDMDEAVALHQRKTKQLRLDKPRKLGAAQLVMGSPKALEVKLQEGCSRIDAVAGKPLGPFRASLWSQQGDDLSQGRGAARATLFHCTAKEERVRIELLANHSGGPVEVYARHDDTPPVELVKHPLAAARLLRRLEAELGPIDPKDASGAQHIALQPGRRHRQAIIIMPRRCERIVAALDGPAGALEMTLHHPTGEITRSRGHGVVSERPCAGSDPTRFNIELSTPRGGDVLLLRRALK